jgi:hypothetical protein
VPGEAFCDYCGSPLEPPVPVLQDVPELEPVASAEELEVPIAPPEDQPAEVEGDVEGEEAKPHCLACGAEVSPDEAFCANCGASLAQAPLPPEPVDEPELEAEAEVAPEIEVPVEEEPVAEPVPSEPEEPVAEVAPVSEETPTPSAITVCPACGTEVETGDAFCSACGYTLRTPAAAEPALPPVQVELAPGPRLVVVASGAEIPLPTGEEFLIGREDPVSGIFPEVDLTPHGGEEGGVSRRHARIIVEAGNYYVEDLDSTNFTFVNKQKLVPKSRQPVGDGDEIRCGRVALLLKVS